MGGSNEIQFFIDSSFINALDQHLLITICPKQHPGPLFPSSLQCQEEDRLEKGAVIETTLRAEEPEEGGQVAQS